MNMVTLAKQQVMALIRESRVAMPCECCGFLLGERGSVSRFVKVILPAPNSVEQKYTTLSYFMAPEHFLHAEKRAEEQKMQLLGFYHSHPNGAREPSPADIRNALPCYLYFIVALSQGGRPSITAWELWQDRSRFESVPVGIVNSGEKVTCL